jgi:triphosphoribosyl-dephospho-CoA synthase
MKRPVASQRAHAKSSFRLTPRLVAATAEAACLLEARAPKPGNVSPGRERPGLTYRDFVVSASILGSVFRRRAGRSRVGALVLETIRRSRAQVGTNTHLGIVLLLAPLAKAALLEEGRARASLRDRLLRVLGDLDRRDARDAYEAIRLARPGGLGRVPEEDVRHPPAVTLLEAMRLAAERDAVARAYASGYEAVFATGVPAITRLRRRGAGVDQAIAGAFLELLAKEPDTLVRRRHGDRVAERVSRQAALALRAGGPLRPAGRRILARLDARLRAARPPINPGATADLVAASLFVWLLPRPSGARGAPGPPRRNASPRGRSRSRRLSP